MPAVGCYRYFNLHGFGASFLIRKAFCSCTIRYFFRCYMSPCLKRYGQPNGAWVQYTDFPRQGDGAMSWEPLEGGPDEQSRTDRTLAYHCA